MLPVAIAYEELRFTSIYRQNFRSVKKTGGRYNLLVLCIDKVDGDSLFQVDSIYFTFSLTILYLGRFPVSRNLRCIELLVVSTVAYTCHQSATDKKPDVTTPRLGSHWPCSWSNRCLPTKNSLKTADVWFSWGQAAID